MDPFHNCACSMHQDFFVVTEVFFLGSLCYRQIFLTGANSSAAFRPVKPKRQAGGQPFLSFSLHQPFVLSLHRPVRDITVIDCPGRCAAITGNLIIQTHLSLSPLQFTLSKILEIREGSDSCCDFFFLMQDICISQKVTLGK